MTTIDDKIALEPHRGSKSTGAVTVRCSRLPIDHGRLVDQGARLCVMGVDFVHVLARNQKSPIDELVIEHAWRIVALCLSTESRMELAIEKGMTFRMDP